MQQRELCACTKYCMDLQAADFGACACGEPRDRHAPAALAAGARDAKEREADKARA